MKKCFFLLSVALFCFLVIPEGKGSIINQDKCFVDCESISQDIENPAVDYVLNTCGEISVSVVPLETKGTRNFVAECYEIPVIYRSVYYVGFV